MTTETKEYFRTILSNLDHKCDLINEIIEDDYLQDDDEFAPIFEAIEQLQNDITEYQEINNYI